MIAMNLEDSQHGKCQQGAKVVVNVEEEVEEEWESAGKDA